MSKIGHLSEIILEISLAKLLVEWRLPLHLACVIYYYNKYHAEGKTRWWILHIMKKKVSMRNDDTKSLLPLLILTIKWLLFFCHLREKVLMNNRGVMSTISFFLFFLCLSMFFGVAVHFCWGNFAFSFCRFVLINCCVIVENFPHNNEKSFSSLFIFIVSQPNQASYSFTQPCVCVSLSLNKNYWAGMARDQLEN